jgi:EF-P beta-lysylation protein EpmB
MNNKKLWQEAMSDLLTDPEELLSLLQLDPSLLEAARAAASLFPLRVPRGFVARMKKGDPDDPLLRQVLPLGAELVVVDDFSRDPLREAVVNPVPGLLHKYPSRVLVTLTSACAVHCRYCFRRYFPYEDNNPGRVGWGQIIDYIQSDERINEVILSGGDPLSVSDNLLRQFTDKLAQVPHVNRLRIHTRLPIVLPERITDEFMQWSQDLPMRLVIVVHVNHAQEISADVAAVLNRLRAAGITLLNQSVLLKGVNDDTKALAALSEALFACGVLPYYLHVLDKVEGAAHFDIPLNAARHIHAELATVLPGYLLPRLVCETPGAMSKTLLSTELITA